MRKQDTEPDGIIHYPADGQMYAYTVKDERVTWCCLVGGGEVDPDKGLIEAIMQDVDYQKSKRAS